MAQGEVKSRTFNWMTKVLEKIPDYYADKRDHLLFEFSNGKKFRGNPDTDNTSYDD